MAEQTTPVEPSTGNAGIPKKPDAPTPPELQKQLKERDEEILRLRDLLIGKDAELGSLRGQLAIQEQYAHRLASLAARIPIPGLGRLLGAVLRRLRG